MTSPAPALPRATVVICVYTEKRWDDIVAAVGSVRAQDVRAAEVLVVVDHNPALLERARATAFGPTAGAGAAPTRTGRACPELATPPSPPRPATWWCSSTTTPRPGRAGCGALLAPYADPDVVAVGGVAHPRFPERAPGPAAQPGERAPTRPVSSTGSSAAPTPASPPTQAEVRNLMGCNMSVRREVFARVGGFAEDLGRIGRNPLGCEETELCIRVRQAYRRMGREARIVFEPAAQVDHRVSADRVRWAYLRRRSWSEGLSKAAVSRLVGSDDALSTERSLRGDGAARERCCGSCGRDGPRRRWRSSTALAATAAGYLRGRLPGRDGGRCGCPPRTPRRPPTRGRTDRRCRASRVVGPQTGAQHGSDGRRPSLRRVASYVHQRNRLTEGQAHAWERLWPVYGLDVDDAAPVSVPYDPPAWFGRRAPLVLEIGSGTGESTAAAGRRGAGGRPRRRRGLRAGAGPAADAHRRGRPDEPAAAPRRRRRPAARARAARFAAEVRIFFPDPWPKRRHHKRRLVQPDFVSLVASRLAPGGVLHLATDWADYAAQMRAVCSGEPLLENTSTAADGWTPARKGRPKTKFERRAVAEGRDVRDLVFLRNSSPRTFTHSTVTR